jgi:hypothetical protein
MRRTAEDDDDDDDPYDSESDSDDDDTEPCQYCGAAVYDDSPRCPACGNYLSGEDAPSRFPVWVKITALICLVVVVLWVLYQL